MIPFVETVSRCWRLVGALDCGGGKEAAEVAASAATVVALPSVEVRHDGRECVICKEEMGIGRDVCELPWRVKSYDHLNCSRGSIIQF